MSRRVKLVLAAIGVGLAVNVAAARLDAGSDDQRRDAAERDVRARLAAQGVRGARVDCASGLSCTVTLRDGRSAQVDPRRADR